MEIIKDIAAIIGCVISLITLITLFTKGGRRFIEHLFKKSNESILRENQQQTEDIENIKDLLTSMSERFDALESFTRQECRNVLKDIYYKYCHEKKIPLYERKTADHMYDLYTKKFNGNSYATLLYSEICKWEIVSPVGIESIITDDE